MTKSSITCLAVCALVVVGAFAGSAAASPGRASALALVPANAVGPSAGPPAAPRGWLPLHAGDFAVAKAAANRKAGVGAARPAKGGGGNPTFFSYANVTPSFNGTY